MKYVVVRCEDGAKFSSQPVPLLEGAKTVYLQQLAQAGAAGLIRNRAHQSAIDRLAVHRGLLGVASKDPAIPAGQCYAGSMNLKLAPGESVWCCDFVTQQDSIVVDPAAGRIPTKESALLLQALNAQLGSETRRWEVGHGSHHLLVTHDASLKPDPRLQLPPPELLAGQRWVKQLPKHPTADALRLLAEQAAEILETHSVNRVRIDLGENPANFLWLWGGAEQKLFQTFTQCTGLSGALVSSNFPMRGLAQALQLRWSQGPTSLEEKALQRVAADVARLIGDHDMVYVHLRIDSADPVERLCAMERVDQLLVKSIAERLPQVGTWRLLTAIDDRTNVSIPFIAIGSGLPQQPVAQLHGQGMIESPLAFAESAELFSWFTQRSE